MRAGTCACDTTTGRGPGISSFFWVEFVLGHGSSCTVRSRVVYAVGYVSLFSDDTNRILFFCQRQTHPNATHISTHQACRQVCAIYISRDIDTNVWANCASCVSNKQVHVPVASVAPDMLLHQVFLWLDISLRTREATPGRIFLFILRLDYLRPSCRWWISFMHPSPPSPTRAHRRCHTAGASGPPRRVSHLSPRITFKRLPVPSLTCLPLARAGRCR